MQSKRQCLFILFKSFVTRSVLTQILLFVISAFQGEKIQTILKAANVDVEPYWPGLFAKALEGINPKDLITNVGSGVGAAAPAAGGAGMIISHVFVECPDFDAVYELKCNSESK